MKKNLLNTVMALCIGLFTSCSQEDIVSQPNGEEQTVSVSAQLPMNANTRALPGAGENHQLRCILEVWDKAENGTLITRIEKLSTDATDGKLAFSFKVDSKVNYQCLLWADFIAADATSSSTADGNTQYADKYYKTANLKAIDFNVADASLFNTANSDAFCGKVDKNGTTTQLSVTLKRPFTKVTLKDNSDYIKECKGLDVSYETPSGYNIATGLTTTYKEIKAASLTPDAANKVWFSTYIFASADKQKLDKPVTLTITKNDDTTETKTIKADQISLDGNVENNAEANFAAEDDVTIDVDINGGMEDPNAPKIGHFLNKDGSTSATFDADKAIGIVFAVGAKGTDTGANYGSSFTGKTIYGYAMGLTSVARLPINQKEDGTLIGFPDLTGINTSTIVSAPWAENDYNGYQYTQALEGIFTEDVKASKLITTYTTWKNSNAATGMNLSSWYIPSSRQLADIIGMTYGSVEKTDNNASEVTIPAITKSVTLAAAIAATNLSTEEKSYFGSYTSATNIMTSFVRSGRIMAIQTSFANKAESINQFLGVTVSVAVPTEAKSAAPFAIRPILTIFKP